MSAVPVSTRVEQLLNKVNLSVVNYDRAGSTAASKTALTQSEAAANFSGIHRAAFLTLVVWGGFAIERDYHELKHALIRQVLMKEVWFCPKLYLAKEDYQHKVDGLLYGAIEQIALGHLELKPHFIAESMGITTRAYRKTWKERHLAVHHQLIDWLHNGAVLVHENLKN